MSLFFFTACLVFVRGSIFSRSKSKRGIGRGRKTNTIAAVCSHARQSHGVVLSADAGNGDLSPGKGLPQTFSFHPSSHSVIVCSSRADSMWSHSRQLCNIPRNRLQWVKKQANVLFRQLVDLITSFLNHYHLL